MKAFLIFFIFLTIPFNASYAQEASKTDLRAQKVIDACWALSKDERDSGVTSRMREGTNDTIHCLEDEINTISSQYFGEKNEKKEFQKSVKRLTENAYTVYYDLYNSHKGCSPCGTMYQVAYLGHVSTLLEDILKNMYSISEEYDIPLEAP